MSIGYTTEEIANLAQSEFDQLYSIDDILKGNTVEMMTEARKIVIQKIKDDYIHIKETAYEVLTGNDIPKSAAWNIIDQHIEEAIMLHKGDITSAIGFIIQKGGI